MDRDLELTTTAIANPGQAAAWNGPEGRNWAKHSARRVADGDLVADLLGAAGVGRDERVLDIGCGTGELTRQCARLAVDGSALGVDLSELMIVQAREEAAAQHIRNAMFETGDVQTHPFPPGGFDVALSHFGVMFFSDPVAAFANVARSLRRGGRLAFVCPASMDRCDWYRVPLAALYGHAPTAAEAPSAMFSLADPIAVGEILAFAGFAEVTVVPLDASLWFGADAQAAAEAFVGSGPARAYLERNPTVRIADVRTALVDAVLPYLGSDGVRIPGAHWLVQARRSGGAA